MPLDPASTPQFTAVLGGTPYAEWTSMTLARSLEHMSGEFTLELSRREQDKDVTLSDAIAPEQPVQIQIDGALVLDGYIDDVKMKGDKETDTITVSGRDKTCDLIDCSATIDGPFEYLNIKLDAFVQKVVKPFGIKVSVASGTSVGTAFPRLAIQPGETAFETIDRACRFRQLLVVSDGIGGIVLVAPHSETSPGKLVYGQNILERDVDLDAKGLFSLYVVKGCFEPLAADTDAETDAGTLARPEGRATDPGVTRYRPKLITGENQGYALTLKGRAEWEKKMAIARSKKATFVVQGWYADGSTLWKPNTVVSVDDPPSGLSRNMLINGVKFSRDNDGGTKTSLDLVLPEAFDLPPERNKANNKVWAADND